jgi:acetyl-CoA carboxylase carboxyl transferase subunit beta
MPNGEPRATGPYDFSIFEGPAIRKKREVPDGLWMRCPQCEETLYRKTVVENLDVCPRCQHHFRIGARRRIEILADPGTFEELFADIHPADPLEFNWRGISYRQYLEDCQKRSGSTEAVMTGIAYIRGLRVALGVMDGDFIIGTLGSVVGEKVTLLIEKAIADRLPLVIVCMSGGARMHEGAMSLMQMGKISAALARLDEAGGLYIAVLANPTLGGTSASFAMLGDVTLAEPGAEIGFAGPRVLANTIKAELPEGFQRSEFLLDHGFIDRIVHRRDLRSELARLIDYLAR